MSFRLKHRFDQQSFRSNVVPSSVVVPYATMAQ